MAYAAIFSSLRRRRWPVFGVSLAPIDLADLPLVQTLTLVSSELISSATRLSITPFQRKNSRSLIRKIRILLIVFDYLRNSDSPFPPSATLCFKELYILIYRAKILLDYCSNSSRLWLLIHTWSISRCFHDLNQEISTILDVFPLRELDLVEDVKEQIDLLRKQLNRATMFVDPHEEMLRLQINSFVDGFEEGRVPDPVELKEVFVGGLGIRSARICRGEIEFLEEQIRNRDEEMEPNASILSGFVAVARYARFLVFDILQEGKDEEIDSSRNLKKSRKNLITREIGQAFLSMPKDFCCPISLDMMQDPVIASTGQTYDRVFIVHWMEQGNGSCPKTGQMLNHNRLIPNRALRSVISQWCYAHGIPLDPLENSTGSTETVSPLPRLSKAAIEANRATAKILIPHLSNELREAKTIAARELRLLAKTGRENRASIAEAGAIPLLQQLLSSEDPITQENSVTAILNLSIHEANKSRIMEQQGCLKSIVEVLRFGSMREARENAAAALFSLSAVHDYKKRITDEEGGIEALAEMLREGGSRGKKDAATALYNLCTHSETCERMVESGAVAALVGALATDGVAEEAAGALTFIMKRDIGAEAVGREEGAVSGLMGVMRRGTPKGKENALVALLEMSRSGAVGATERVVRAPGLPGLLQMLMYTGTKRARRKALSLVKVCQMYEASVPVPEDELRGWGGSYAFPVFSGSLGASFGGDVSVSMSISVPVL